MDKKDKRKKILRASGLIGLFLLVFGLSYALFTVTLNGTKKVKVKTGKLELQLLDENDNPIYITGQNNTTSYEINLDNQVPVDDETGLGTQGFEFKLKNNGTISASYTIYLDDVALESGETRLPDSAVRYSLTKNGSEDNPQDLTTIGTNQNRKLDEGIIKKDVTNTYTLKIWIDEEATNAAMDKVFNATLRVEGTQYVQTGPFEDGTMAATLYAKGTVGEYNTTDKKVPNGFDSNSEESGLYKYTDEMGTTTYAYRGKPADNYVSIDNQRWRVLRIQKNGNIKIVKEDSIGGSEYNTEPNDWYSFISQWYQNNLINFDNIIVENEYCEDYYENKNSAGYMNYFSDYNSLYGIFNRTIKNIDEKYEWYPSLSCSDGTIVNLKAGTITADEYILAGGGYNVGNNTYIGESVYSFWTMSPAGEKNSSEIFYYIHAYSGLGPFPTSITQGLIPVITLKANTTIASGDGTSEHPYVIS